VYEKVEPILGSEFNVEGCICKGMCMLLLVAELTYFGKGARLCVGVVGSSEVKQVTDRQGNRQMDAADVN
jgi:hypothetical protein